MLVYTTSKKISLKFLFLSDIFFDVVYTSIVDTLTSNQRKNTPGRGGEGLYVKAMLLGGNNYAFTLQ